MMSASYIWLLSLAGFLALSGQQSHCQPAVLASVPAGTSPVLANFQHNYNQEQPAARFTLPINQPKQQRPAQHEGLGQMLGKIRENVLSLMSAGQQRDGGASSLGAQANAMAMATMAAIDEQKEKGLALIEKLCDTVGNRVEQFIKPAQNYAALVKRYQEWLAKHKALEESQPLESKIRPAMDIVKEEYAKLDDELMREKCQGNSEAEDSHESLDFVFEILRKLTERLEARFESELDEANVRGDSIEAHLEQQSAGQVVDEQQVTNAFERLKRISMKWAADVAINEVPRLIKIFIIKAAAVHFATHPSGSEGPLLIVEQTISLLGSASVPIAVMYLRDIQVRTAFLVLDAFVQPDEMVCRIKKGLSIK